MKSSMVNVVLVIALLACNSASAVNWQRVATNKDKVFYIDLDVDSVKQTNKYISLKYNEIISASLKFTYLENSDRNQMSVQQRWFVDCKDNEYFIDSYVKYDNNSNFLESNRMTHVDANGFNYAHSDTVADDTVQAICNYHKKGYTGIVDGGNAQKPKLTGNLLLSDLEKKYGKAKPYNPQPQPTGRFKLSDLITEPNIDDYDIESDGGLRAYLDDYYDYKKLAEEYNLK